MILFCNTVELDELAEPVEYRDQPFLSSWKFLGERIEPAVGERTEPTGTVARGSEGT